MKIFIKGKGEVTLTDNDFIAEGGAGKVYGKNGVAYKLYKNISDMIPLQKITELSAIKNDRIIRPVDIILNPKNNAPMGYTMKLLDNGTTTPLSQLFTKGFRNRNGLQPADMIVLVKDTQKTYSDIHAAKCLVIDGNDFNFRVSNQMDAVYFLDADSFKTPSYPATYQMESIKDWHTQGFNENTDWFAWAVVTFNLLIGIHPFKGFHKTYADDFILRMKNNISVFAPDVSLPPVVQPFSVIPQTLLAYYKAVFQDGKRLPPPNDYDGAAIIVVADVRHISGTDKFEITLVEAFPSDVVEYLSVNGTRVKLTTDITKKYKGAIHTAIGPRMGRVFFANIDNGSIAIRSDKDQPNLVNIAAEQMMSYAGDVYYKFGPSIYRLEIHETNIKTLITPRAVGNAHENNTKLFDGIAIMNLLGVAHTMVFPTPNTSYTVGIKEIKGKIIDAKYDNRIAMVVTADQKGKYHRLVIRFAKDFKSYEIVQTVDDITYTGLNFVTLDKGICCNINEKGEVELFTNQVGNALMKVVSDPMINTDMQLTKDGDQVMFFKGKELYTLKMK